MGKRLNATILLATFYMSRKVWAMPAEGFGLVMIMMVVIPNPIRITTITRNDNIMIVRMKRNWR